MTVLNGVHTDSILMTSFQTDHTGWSQHRKHGISIMRRWYHKYLPKLWSTQLHNIVIQTIKLQTFIANWIEPLSSRNPTWRSLVPETIDCYRTRKTDRTRTHPNRTEPAPTHQPIRNGLHQPIRIGYSEPIRSQHFCTNQLLLVSNERIWLVNLNQSKNYPNNFLIG